MNMETEIRAALDAAHFENEYPHDFALNPIDIVNEILECAGISGYDEDSKEDQVKACAAVICWRDENYDKLKEVN